MDMSQLSSEEKTIPESVKQNGAAPSATPKELDPNLLEKVSEVRSQVRENFGKVVMAMMTLPRYRNQTLSDLHHLVLEPLIRDRIAIAYPGDKDTNALADIAGVAIWASVSDEVDAKIREQIQAGSFPVRLSGDEWNSGTNNWLLDIIAPNQKLTASVIGNFKHVVKEGSLHLHPVITRLVVDEILKQMGAEKSPAKMTN